MTKLLWLLISSGLLLTPTLATAQVGLSIAPVTADTTASPSNPLRQILDSLRKRPDLKGVKIKLQDINFETNSFVLTAGSAVYLDTVASVLNKFPSLILEIGGHTDDVGTPQSNKLLSENRAQAVRSRLVGVGKVPAKRLTFKGYGEARPVATNTTQSGRLLNRRVEMQFEGLSNEQLTKIYLRDGQIIQAPLVYLNEQTRTVLYKTGENAPLREFPCASVLKLMYADGRVQTLDCPPGLVVTPTPYERPVVAKRPSPLYLQIHGGAGYMIGESPSWTSKTEGYAHILGFGGGLSVGYRLTKRISAGLQTGYCRWSTQVNYREEQDGPVIRQYNSSATQIPLTLAVSLYLTRSVYLMPEGGLNLLMIDAGFGPDRDKFSGIQTTYGGILGYTTDRSKRVWADAGVFYRVHQKGTWDRQYGIPAMNYAGLKLGLGFSL